MRDRLIMTCRLQDQEDSQHAVSCTVADWAMDSGCWAVKMEQDIKQTLATGGS